MIPQVWEPIKGYENYSVSNYGEVKNSRGRLLKSYRDGKGYMSVALCRNGIPKTSTVHRLVAIAFIPNPENKPTVNHINGIKTDNRAENLEWASQSENNKHAYDTGLSVAKRNVGEQNGRAKLTNSNVFEIKELLKDKELKQKEIAIRYGVHPTRIGAIKNGKAWT